MPEILNDVAKGLVGVIFGSVFWAIIILAGVEVRVGAKRPSEIEELCSVALRVHVPNYQICTQNLYDKYYYPNPKYLIIVYLDPKP